MLPESLKKLAKLFTTLPGIGPRQAQRLVFFLTRQGKSQIEEFKDAFNQISAHVKLCTDCFLPYEGEGAVCSICSDKKRDPRVIAIVEKETDLLSIEKTKNFSGHYLILGELKKDGVLEREHKARLEVLKKRITRDCDGIAEEIIIALSPTAYGDINAMTLNKELSGLAKKITRLGRGLTTGSELEYSDPETIVNALTNRK